MTLADRLDRIEAAPAWVVSGTRLPDIRRFRPGQPIVVNSIGSLRQIQPAETPMLGCIAGWISDEEAASEPQQAQQMPGEE